MNNTDNNQTAKLNKKQKIIIAVVFGIIVALILIFMFTVGPFKDKQNSDNSVFTTFSLNTDGSIQTIIPSDVSAPTNASNQSSHNSGGTGNTGNITSPEDTVYQNSEFGFSLKMKTKWYNSIYIVKKENYVSFREKTNSDARFGGILFDLYVLPTDDTTVFEDFKVVKTTNEKKYIAVFPTTPQYVLTNEKSSGNYLTAKESVDAVLESLELI